MGCSSSSELEDFTKTFNLEADAENVAKLLPSDFGDIDEDEMQWNQKLYVSDKYEISSMYKTHNLIICNSNIRQYKTYTY